MSPAVAKQLPALAACAWGFLGGYNSCMAEDAWRERRWALAAFHLLLTGACVILAIW